MGNKEYNHKTWESFAKKVKPLSQEQLKRFKLKPDSIENEVGVFAPRRLAELKDIVEKNGGLHIISSTSDYDSVPGGKESWRNDIATVNRLGYALAEGDKGNHCYTCADEFDSKGLVKALKKLNLFEKSSAGTLSMRDCKALDKELKEVPNLHSLADERNAFSSVEDLETFIEEYGQI